MSVSGVTSATALNSTFGLAANKSQVSAPTKAEADEATAAANDAAQQANEIATERQASTHGNSQSINKLA
jgi:hypothetical protein